MAERIRLYFAGRNPEEAIKSVPVLEEKTAKELVADDDVIYALDVSVFASRLKKVSDVQD